VRLSLEQNKRVCAAGERSHRQSSKSGLQMKGMESKALVDHLLANAQGRDSLLPCIRAILCFYPYAILHVLLTR
jgi:hypothetical protein